MDAPGLPVAGVADAYAVLGRVNRQLGNLRTLERELLRGLQAMPRAGPPPTILDVGSGGGDLPAALAPHLAARGYPVRFLALDRDPTAVALTAAGGVAPIRGDALRLPFARRSVAIVTAVKFAHHFTGPALTTLLSELARVASERVIVLDIRRHWVAYWGFVAWSRLLTSNRYVRHDGPLSVLRGFTRAELREVVTPLADFRWEVRSYLGFQLALVGSRALAGRPRDPSR